MYIMRLYLLQYTIQNIYNTYCIHVLYTFLQERWIIMNIIYIFVVNFILLTKYLQIRYSIVFSFVLN